MTCVFHAAFGHHSLKKNRRSPAAVNRLLETHIPTLFHTASPLSGSLCSPPSPQGEGGPRSGARVLSLTAHLRRSSSLFFIPLPPSNLRPFGAPPSIGRRECPREPLPLEGAAERSEAGLASFWGSEAPSSLPSPLGKGDRVSGARVLSLTAHLRRSFPLFFIPLVPYPARSARPLPLEGKALSVVILFLHISCIRFDVMGIAAFSFRCLPHWGRGTAPAVDRVLS